MSDAPSISTDAVQQLLDSHLDPETGRPMGSMGQIVDVAVDGQSIQATIGLSTHSLPIEQRVLEQIEAKLSAEFPGCQPELTTVVHPRPAARVGQSALRAKSIIAVGSGKGGVGKSTVATGLALALRSFGCKVGLMDADVYGPSVPHLLGLTGRPAMTESKRIAPITVKASGDAPEMPVMSMGFMVEPDQAVIWRGPMLHGSINQFLSMTEWGELDYLIIDMPPGTGDVALTLSQAIPVTGSVVVCTPQEVALLDAVKAVAMFKKVNTPVLGMVENMSGFRCPDNNKVYDIFGSGGTRQKAEELSIACLATLPIDIELREAGDEGRLAEVIETNTNAGNPLKRMAQSLVEAIAMRTTAAPPAPSLPTL